MNKQRYEKLLTTGFCCILSGMMLVNFAKADELFSPTENRSLAQEPELSLDTLLDGSFMTDYETYLNDQFFSRDHWVAMKSVMERLMGKQENNAVFFGTQNTLLNQVDTPDASKMETNSSYMNTLVENLNVPLYVGLIPSAAEVWSDRLPSYAPTADESTEISKFYQYLSSDIQTLPMNEGLTAHKSEDIFYRTDHHWTSLGAYYGYETLVNTMGLTPTPLSSLEKTQVSDAFFGTIYSSSGVRWVKPDVIDTYITETDNIKVTSNFMGTPEEGALYVDSFLQEKDKYSYFLGGVQPLCIIETGLTDAPSVLVIRDSYTDAMAPFLTENFSEIHLLDLRFYNFPVSMYVETNEIDNVVVLYSLFNFVSDSNLFKLGL